MANVVQLPSRNTFTVDQALDNSKTKNLEEVLIIGVDANGELFMNTSRMTRKDALWLMEMGRHWTVSNRDIMSENKFE